MLKRKIFAIFFVCLFVVGYVHAQKLDIQAHQLANGFLILTLERHAVPTLSLQVVYNVGSRNEKPGATGLSHILEHMLFMSTKNYSAHEMDAIIKRNGGERNGATGDDFTHYYATVASDRLELVIAVEAERMQNALIKEEEFQSERKVVMEERRMRVDNSPVGWLREDFHATAYMLHPYRISTIGWMGDVAKMTRGDAYRHYQTYYTPNNSFAVLVGDFDTQNALRLFEKYFGRMPTGPEVPPVTIVEPEQHGERRIWVHKEGNFPALRIGYHTPQVGHPDFYVLDIIGHILATGRSSRLYKTLVYAKQLLLLPIYAYVPDQKDPSLFQIVIRVMPGKSVDEAEGAIYEILEALKNEPVSDEELQKVKNRVMADFYFRQQSNEDLADTIAGYEAKGVGYDYINTYPDKMAAVTKEDIMRVAKKYFIPKNRTVAILVPDMKP